MTTTSIAIIAIAAAALALLGVVVLVVTIVTIPLQQDLYNKKQKPLDADFLGAPI